MRVRISSCPRRSLLVACALALLACDDARSTVATPEEISPSEREAQPSPTPAGEAAGAAANETTNEPPPVEAPELPPGPSCDQRERTKTCVDYGAKRGNAAPRCVDGVELGEQGCAREAVAARCTLPATGVVIYSYEGRPREAIADECETIDGELDLTSPD